MMLAAFVVAALALGASASGICPNGLSGSGYVMGSSCYEFVVNEMTWINALSHCHSRGGRLASITSADIQKWISSQAATVFKGYEGVWIGLNDRKKEGSFIWDNYDGRPDVAVGGYTNWNSGEPDDGWFGQDCVYMRRSYGWRWDDLECNLPYFRSYNFICEYSVVPSTVTSTLSSSTTVASASSRSPVTTVVPSVTSVTRANGTAGNVLTTGMLSSIVAATVRQTANEEPSSPFRVTSEADTLSSKMAITEPAVPASSSGDAGMSLRKGTLPITSTPISLSTSIDSRLQTNGATAESETSTRSAETNVSAHWQSPNSSERTPITEPGHALVYEARNAIEIDAAASKTYLSSTLNTYAAAAESEASTRSSEATVTVHWQSPNSSERTRTTEPVHASIYEARNAIEVKASAVETYLASTVRANATTAESEVSTRSTETSVSIHWQSPSSSEKTRTTEPGHASVYEARNAMEANAAADDGMYSASSAEPPGEPGAWHVGSQERTYNTEMPIYLSVIAIAVIGAIAAFAVLGYKFHKQRQQRPVVGIENPLYGATQRPRAAI